MPEYTITWTIDIDGENPVDAAKKVVSIMRDNESIASVFDVQDNKMQTTRVDLLSQDNSASNCKGPLTTSEFWDCECETNYIYASSNPEECVHCGVSREYGPDSHLDEIMEQENIHL